MEFSPFPSHRSSCQQQHNSRFQQDKHPQHNIIPKGTAEQYEKVFKVTDTIVKDDGSKIVAPTTWSRLPKIDE